MVTDPIHKRYQETIKRALIALLFSCIVFFQEFADPFGMANSTNLVSAKAFAAVTSPFYDSLAEGDAGRQRSNILVLLVDDQYLEATGKSWPLPMRTFRGWIESIADASPSSIFLDIYFHKSNPKRQAEIQSFVEDIRETEQETGVPVVFASLLQDPEAAYHPEIPVNASLAQVIDEGYGRYPLSQTVMDQTHETAAYTLYRHWCASSEECDISQLDAIKDSSIAMQWGFAPSEQLRESYQRDGKVCQEATDTLDSQIFRSFKLLWQKAVNGLTTHSSTDCIYHDFLNVQIFSELSYDERVELVKDKVVLIGTHFSLYPDIKESPVHGLIPGVFWHAMAVDNLMLYENNVLRYKSDEEANSLAWLMTTVALLAYAILGGYLHDKMSHSGEVVEDSTEAHPQVYTVFGLFSIILFGLVIGWLSYWERMAPENWIGIAIALFLINRDPLSAISHLAKRYFPKVEADHSMMSWRWAGQSVFAALFYLSTLGLMAFIGYLALFGMVLFNLINPHASVTQNLLVTFVYFSVGLLLCWMLSGYSRISSHPSR